MSIDFIQSRHYIAHIMRGLVKTTLFRKRERKIMKRPGENYSKDEVNMILKHISKRCPTGIRNRAIVGLLFGSGIRCQELLDLYPGDIDITSGRITIKNGKGSKFRVVGMPEQISASIQLWLNQRKVLRHNGNKPLFCTLKGGQMQSSYIRSFFGRLGKRIEAKTENKLRIHSHGFRHSMASSLLKEGFNIVEIQQQLGHSNLGTTARYLQKIAPETLINSMYARQGVL